jgi:hypothetical protein
MKNPVLPEFQQFLFSRELVQKNKVSSFIRRASPYIVTETR